MTCAPAPWPPAARRRRHRKRTPATSSHSPRCRRPCSHSMSCTTRNVSGTAAAASIDRPCGTGKASRASITAYSAKAPGQRPITRWPTDRPSTPVPMATISPAPSIPAGLAALPLASPPGMNSPRFRPAASISAAPARDRAPASAPRPSAARRGRPHAHGVGLHQPPVIAAMDHLSCTLSSRGAHPPSPCQGSTSLCSTPNRSRTRPTV
jgi:hypothetical protein